MELKFFKGTVGYILFDHNRDKKFLEELEIEPVVEKLRRYKSNWLRHVTGMSNKRMPNIWWKTTWKTFERTIRRDRNRSIKA